MPRGTHFHWEGHASRPESRPNIRPRRLQQLKPARIGESWNSLRALQSALQESLPQCRHVSPSAAGPRVSLEAKGDGIMLRVRDAGVGFPIPFARCWARVRAQASDLQSTRFQIPPR